MGGQLQEEAADRLNGRLSTRKKITRMSVHNSGLHNSYKLVWASVHKASGYGPERKEG